jgi:peptidoglycan hydrolase-like protein with peptidoglycan-binding domain
MQLDAYHRGVAAILKHIGKGPENCIGHKEWAPGRKTDPDLDMTIFRAAVNTILNDSPEPVPVPPINRPVLRSGVDNDPVWVKILQVKMGIKADGIFGPNTAAAVRAFQAGNGIPADGVVGQKTWALIA